MEVKLAFTKSLLIIPLHGSPKTLFVALISTVLFPIANFETICLEFTA